MEEILRKGLKTSLVRYNCLSLPSRVLGDYTDYLGWHCSWCLPIKGIFDKVKNLPSTGVHLGKFHDLQSLKEIIQEGIWLPEYKKTGRKLPNIEKRIPKFVLHNRERFKYLFGDYS